MDFVLDNTWNPVIPGDTVHCWQTQYDFTFPVGWNEGQYCHGLILRPPGSDKSLYERVGKFQAALEWFDEATVEAITTI